MISNTRIILTTLAISIPLYIAHSVYGTNPAHMGGLTKQAQIDGLTKKVQECEKEFQNCKKINGSYKIITDSKEYNIVYGAH